MPTYSLHFTCDESVVDPEDVEAILAPYVEAFEDITWGSEQVNPPIDDGVFVAEESLEMAKLETYATLYRDLQEDPAFVELGRWGPAADRFPVPVYHYALQQIPYPDLCEYHALDGEVTLVVLEGREMAEQLKQDLPSSALA